MASLHKMNYRKWMVDAETFEFLGISTVYEFPGAKYLNLESFRKGLAR